MAYPAEVHGGEIGTGTLIEHINNLRASSLPFAAPKRVSQTTEASLVRDVLQVLQGYSTSSVPWDRAGQRFYVRNGIHVLHLSQSSLYNILQVFSRAGTSLRRVEFFIRKVMKGTSQSWLKPVAQSYPTLEALVNVVNIRLESLRRAVLEKELDAAAGKAVTLLSLFSNLSKIFTGAEFLEHLLDVAVPEPERLFKNEISAAELATQILSSLYGELDAFSLVHDGEEDAYGTLLLLLVGCLWPMITSVNTWLQEGILSDPAGELCFYADDSVPIEDSAFWDRGYHLRYTGGSSELYKDVPSGEQAGNKLTSSRRLSSSLLDGDFSQGLACPSFLQPLAKAILSAGKSLQLLQHVRRKHGEGDQTSSEVVHPSSKVPSPSLPVSFGSLMQGPGKKVSSEFEVICSSDRGSSGLTHVSNSMVEEQGSLYEQFCVSLQALLGQSSHETLSTESPTSGEELGSNWLSPLSRSGLSKDEIVDTLFREQGSKLGGSLPSAKMKVKAHPRHGKRGYMGFETPLCRVTDFDYGLGCENLLFLHNRQYLTAIEKLLPYPTLLPSFQEHCNVSRQLLSQGDSQEAVNILEWLQTANFKATPALVVVQECLTYFIQKQVDHVGQQLLAKLMGEWRLMEELALLRTIYLVGSGDLLQQFASVLFNKLDRGEPWDDFYELNTMLQESVRSSSHGMVLPALDSLVVTVSTRTLANVERGLVSTSHAPQISGRAPSFGIDSLDCLFFTYKVAWPLELIIDSNAIKKYNQVMLFLLKVKRAKHALDKACRWTWKNGVGDVAVHKQRVLLQQKLMHFVNTLHQYIMDRVLYSAWVELSDSMSSAVSLDEVIACHDAYLVSIQRQCLVAPDKLWTLISGRVKTILGLAVNYYSIQRILCDGIGAPALNARCQLEIERVERQFDECMVFLMRVLSFKLNVGHFPHLADLVTRINYNFYYLTEDGQLSTPIPEAARRTLRRI